jgi:hypothetical protein
VLLKPLQRTEVLIGVFSDDGVPRACAEFRDVVDGCVEGNVRLAHRPGDFPFHGSAVTRRLHYPETHSDLSSGRQTSATEKPALFKPICPS